MMDGGAGAGPRWQRIRNMSFYHVPDSTEKRCRQQQQCATGRGETAMTGESGARVASHEIGGDAVSVDTRQVAAAATKALMAARESAAD